MAAFDFHRKLSEDCTLCDPIQNPNAICTSLCSQLCPNVCTTTQSPQPPPLPPTDDYILVFTPPKHHHSSLSIPLKISLVILVLTFSLFLLYTLYKFYTVWYRSRTRRPPPPSSPPPSGDEETVDEFVDHDVLDHPIWYIRTIGLQPSVISAITVVKYNKTDGLIEGTDCSVCLSDFEQDEMLRLLPKCNHAFHISCIDTWLRSHTNCPLCRAGIVKNTTTTTTTTTNSSSSDQNLDDDSGQIEEAQMVISISDEVHGEDDDQGSELRIGVIDEEDLNDNNNKGEVVGGGGTSDFLIIRRSVSLNDYAACRVRSDVNNNNNNNCYYSDRHQVQIQPVEGDWELSRRDLEMI